jgi:hypothetical protein
MSQVDYATMTDAELKRYFLEHRHDEAALQAYLDRRQQRPKRIITTVDNPEFDAKIQAVIEQQLKKK